MNRWPGRSATAILIVVLAASPLLPAAMAESQPGTPAPAGTPMVAGGADTTNAPRHWDGYDIGAAAVNVVWVPFKIGVCAISGGLGALVFVASLGTARDWSASAFHEGCVDKWLIEGDDLRPVPSSGWRSGQAPRPM